jgi:hypothetical protein
MLFYPTHPQILLVNALKLFYLKASNYLSLKLNIETISAPSNVFLKKNIAPAFAVFSVMDQIK